MSKIRQTIGKYFDYYISFEMVDIIENCIERIDLEEFKESNNQRKIVSNAVDDELIYYESQWEVLKNYCASPSELTESSLDEAFEELENDIMDICKLLLED